VIGWSLGGNPRPVQLSGGVHPAVIRQGHHASEPRSRLKDQRAQQTAPARAYELLRENGTPKTIQLPWRAGLGPTGPSQPPPSYTRLDGIVAWRACLDQAPPASPENVEVYASHFGIGKPFPAALWVIADRLTPGAPGKWAPFRPPGPVALRVPPTPIATHAVDPL